METTKYFNYTENNIKMNYSNVEDKYLEIDDKIKYYFENPDFYSKQEIKNLFLEYLEIQRIFYRLKKRLL